MRKPIESKAAVPELQDQTARLISEPLLRQQMTWLAAQNDDNAKGLLNMLEKLPVPQLLQMAQAYIALHEGLSDMIERGVLSPEGLPEDWQWLDFALGRCVIAGYAFEDEGGEL